MTSRVVVGVAVAMPILAEVPLPLWVMAEFSMSVPVLNRGMVFTVPPAVVTFEAGGGAFADEADPLAEETDAAGAARTNADGGNPPMVSASPAFSA